MLLLLHVVNDVVHGNLHQLLGFIARHLLVVVLRRLNCLHEFILTNHRIDQVVLHVLGSSSLILCNLSSFYMQICQGELFISSSILAQLEL